MSIALKIKDENSVGKEISATILRFPANEVTVRELIEKRVKEEVERYNKNLSKCFIGLVQPSESELEHNGYRLKSPHPINAEKQCETAINAFRQNGFFIFLNDKQLCDLHHKIIITPKTEVIFLKLIPLVGG